MATKNSFSSRNLNKLVGVLLVFLTACSGIERRRQEQEARPMPGGHSVEGASTSATPQPAGPAEKPSPIEDKLPQGPLQVGVILGPGGARALAESGVLKGLVKARVPIAAIVGLEWGAVVGALYAHAGLVHEVEWNIYKSDKMDFVKRGFFSSGFQAVSANELQPFLKSIFNGRRLEGGKIPFMCPVMSPVNGTMHLVDRGDTVEMLGRCVPYPPLFKTDKNWIAEPFALRESLDWLKRRGIDVVILINPIARGEIFDGGQLKDFGSSAILWLELKRQLQAGNFKNVERIDVDVRGFKIFDFEQKNQLMQLGEQVGSEAGRELANKYGF